MPRVDQSVIVPHTPAQMFALVDDVERYPEFLPWCGGATVHERSPDVTEASLHIRYGKVNQSFRTRNTKTFNALMQLQLVDGPFSRLGGSWQFYPLGTEGCKVVFSLDYTFANPVMETLIGPVFAMIAKTFVERFVARAGDVYSRPSAV